MLESNALTTVDAVVSYLGLGEEVCAPTIDRLIYLINCASSYIETMTDRKFGLSEYVELLRGTGTTELYVSQYPVRKIVEIMDIESGNIIDDYLYEYDTDGKIYRSGGWPIRGFYRGLSNDLVMEQRYLRIKYTAGYLLPKDSTNENRSDLPYDLQSIVWQMVQQQWYLSTNGAHGLTAFSLSDVSWTFDKELSVQVNDIIKKYRRYI